MRKTDGNRHICTIDETRTSREVAAALPRLKKWWQFARNLRFATDLHPATHKHLKSSHQIQKENERLLHCYPPWVVHPFSRLRMYCDVLVFVVMNLHLTLLPLAFSFLAFLPHGPRRLVECFDLILCLVLAGEFALRFCTGYVVPATYEIVLEPKRIALRRLHPFGLLYGLLLFMPFILLLEVFHTWIVGAGAEASFAFVSFLYLTNIVRFRESNRYFRIIPRTLGMPESKIRILQVLMNTLYVLHWTTCLAYIIPLLLTSTRPGTQSADQKLLLRALGAEVSHPNLTSFGSVTDPFVRQRLADLQTNASPAYRYFRSLMLTLRVGLASCEQKDLEQHFMYQWIMWVVMLLGWVWFNYLPVVLCRFLDSPEMADDQYDRFLANLRAYAYNKRVNLRLERKLRDNFATRFRTGFFDEAMIMGLFPRNLRSSVKMETCQHLVASVDIFKNLPYSILTDIVDCLQLEVYLEGDVIISAGSFGDSMYFLAAGTVAVYAMHGKELGHLTDGAYFGEISLIKRDQQRTANVVALEPCELYRLSHEDFQSVIQPHAYLLNRIRKQAEERLAATRRKKDKLFRNKLINTFLQ
ncbi:potassium/sodium hyperpolarization-activated cyclic nucleotide-gated channel 1-like [Anopheles bellator]|uniref:potassium/sodium hyperpolarization-activated cyclic nucleotide-gated channel 1-like n=1 Tax=Anopheles bellator TaxID=139047 RepID=UPI00264A15D3|nr:potassium/sodium hyperpolarization-activated cyclic nucleotide-gated channel 1-like [Anopheles bellator]